MKRDLKELSSKVYDLLVVGGGVYGAWTAWDAALRGLKVALVEKGDFCSATSYNSLKIAHGGLRYLQHADLRRARNSIMERAALLKVAPHLVHPLPFVIPTYTDLMKSRALFSIALALNEVVGAGKNRSIDRDKRIPRSRTISREEVLGRFPHLMKKGLTGGAVFYDCQIRNSERLVLSILKSAAGAGAEVANYVEAEGFIRDGDRVLGIKAVDKDGGSRFDIRANTVINTTGPWINTLLGRIGTNGRGKGCPLTLAFNVLTNRLTESDHVLGLWSNKTFKDADAVVDKGTRMFFITPWEGFSFTGTAQEPYHGDPDEVDVPASSVAAFLDELNDVYPTDCSPGDVLRVYWGLVPGPDHNPIGDFRKEPVFIDHRKVDRVSGVYSVAGVKFTEARLVARKVLDTVTAETGVKSNSPGTSITPVHGGEAESMAEIKESAESEKPASVCEDSLENLISNHGAAYREVFGLFENDPGAVERLTPLSPVIKAEITHSIRSEMALKLSDIIFRRTSLGLAFDGRARWIRDCAELAAREAGWSEQRTRAEISDTEDEFSSKRPLRTTS